MTLDDILAVEDIRYRDILIEDGLAACKTLFPQQQSPEDRMFYFGSIAGFEECKGYASLSAFTGRLCALHREEETEISKGSLSDPYLRRMLGLKSSDTITNDNKVWYLKGVRTQVEFVYERLAAYDAMKSIVCGDMRIATSDSTTGRRQFP